MGSLICSAWWRSFPEPSLSCRQPFRNEDFLLAVVIQERPAMCRHLIRRMGWDKRKWGDKSGAGRFGEHASRVSASGVSSRGLVSQRMSNVNLWPRRFRCGAPPNARAGVSTLALYPGHQSVATALRGRIVLPVQLSFLPTISDDWGVVQKKSLDASLSYRMAASHCQLILTHGAG